MRDDIIRLAELLDSKSIGLVEYSMARLVIIVARFDRPNEFTRVSLDLTAGMIPWWFLDSLPVGTKRIQYPRAEV
jgi:hypothetical protein